MKNIVLGTVLCATVAMGFQIEGESKAIKQLRDPQQCIEQNCPNEWSACQKDSKCVSTLQDCQKKCTTNQTCWKICLANKGDGPAIDIAKCAQAHDCLSIVSSIQ